MPYAHHQDRYQKIDIPDGHALVNWDVLVGDHARECYEDAWDDEAEHQIHGLVVPEDKAQLLEEVCLLDLLQQIALSLDCSRPCRLMPSCGISASASKFPTTYAHGSRKSYQIFLPCL